MFWMTFPWLNAVRNDFRVPSKHKIYLHHHRHNLCRHHLLPRTGHLHYQFLQYQWKVFGDSQISENFLENFFSQIEFF